MPAPTGKPEILCKIDQNLFDISHPTITVGGIKNSRVTQDTFAPFIQPAIGLAAGFNTNGKLNGLALAAASRVLIIEFPAPVSKFDNAINDPPQKISTKLQQALDILQSVLNHPDRTIYGFDLAPTFVALFLEYGIRLASGVDLQSATTPVAENRERIPLISIQRAVGDDCVVYKDNINSVFEETLFKPKLPKNLALKSWVAQFIAQVSDMEEIYRAAPKLNTLKLPDPVRICYSIPATTYTTTLRSWSSLARWFMITFK